MVCAKCVCVCVCSIRTKVQVKQKWTNTKPWRSNMRTQRDRFPFSLFFPTHVGSELNKHRDLMCTDRDKLAQYSIPVPTADVVSVFECGGCVLCWCIVCPVCGVCVVCGVCTACVSV